MTAPKPMPKVVRGAGIPPLPDTFLVSNPDFRDLWEITVGLSQLSDQEREARVSEIMDPESLTAFVSTFGVHQVGVMINTQETSPVELASLIASTNLLMVMVGAQFALQRSWTLPEFKVPDSPEDEADG